MMKSVHDNDSVTTHSVRLSEETAPADGSVLRSEYYDT
jgi:hypothetical protein